MSKIKKILKVFSFKKLHKQQNSYKCIFYSKEYKNYSIDILNVDNFLKWFKEKYNHEFYFKNENRLNIFFLIDEYFLDYNQDASLYDVETLLLQIENKFQNN